ncbi:MAG: hypothetical protein CFE21_17315 [Bacteroidetes bacterium B1(2017)]|nr:MAG: hypothetical protein CFE21_17315 [Bacteroidetes bacterium B1(2017)]
MIQLGDKVRFLNENMEGIVTSLLGKNQIGVTVDSDFEIPVLISEVVKIKFEDKAGNNPKAEPAKPFRVATNQPLGIFLAFERVGETDLTIHVHNNLSEHATILVYTKEQAVFHLEKSMYLERDETKQLGKTTLSSFDKWLPYQFIILPYESVTVKTANSVTTSLQFNAKTFYNFWKHCAFLNKQAYVFRLDEEVEKVDFAKLKTKDFAEKIEEKGIDFKAKPASIIDLHYDALKQNGYGTAEDITAFQMDVFAKTLEAAFVHHMPEIIFIHGVGNAYLKNKIRTYLSKHPEMVLNFTDADILQFGSGATLVRLK